MEIKEITNKNEWESFLLKQAEKTFLQSWNWGEFNIKMGAKIWRFGVYNGERLIALALVLKVLAPQPRLKSFCRLLLLNLSANTCQHFAQALIPG